MNMYELYTTSTRDILAPGWRYSGFCIFTRIPLEHTAVRIADTAASLLVARDFLPLIYSGSGASQLCGTKVEYEPSASSYPRDILYICTYAIRQASSI